MSFPRVYSRLVKHLKDKDVICYNKSKRKKGRGSVWGCISAAEHFASIFEALDFLPSTPKREGKKYHTLSP
jgi:hypothetical protein